MPSPVVPPYFQLVRHYERCLERYGDSPQGVDWPNARDAQTRYRVMLDVVRGGEAALLDLGCGAGHLLELIEQEDRRLDYVGYDLSEAFVELCKRKFPRHEFRRVDVLTQDFPVFDYVIMNGLFTERRELDFSTMWAFVQSMLRVAFEHARIGVAFNVMSSHVDWERDDLFHLPLDTLATYLVSDLSRRFVVRNDYGLYEYTVYLYK